MRSISALLFAVFLAACAPTGDSHMTDISGAMPALDFQMQRASDGKAVTGQDYRGRITLLYFGYTNCPDVCPATLSNLALMLEELKGADITILFVTVDPARDTLPILTQYAHAFTPRMEGLRGTQNELADVARRYRVAYSVKAGPPYEVMHSGAVFFFDKTGKVRFVTTDTSNPAAMARDVRTLLN